MKKRELFGFLFIICGIVLFFASSQGGFGPQGGFGYGCFRNPNFVRYGMGYGGFMGYRHFGYGTMGVGGLIVILGILFLFIHKARIGITIANIALGIYALFSSVSIFGMRQFAYFGCNWFNGRVSPLAFLAIGIFITLNTIYLIMYCSKTSSQSKVIDAEYTVEE